MSNITFQCMSCDADFEVDTTLLLERPTAIKCPNCGARPPSNRCHSFAQALDDILAAMAGLRTKVQFELNLDTEDLPPPYGPSDEGGSMGSLSSAGSSEDDDDDDDDDDEDGDDDDFEEDDDDFDDDDDFEFDDDEDDDVEEEEE